MDCNWPECCEDKPGEVWCDTCPYEPEPTLFDTKELNSKYPDEVELYEMEGE
jgi:hypothetical protein